jgi:RNA polymerase sigma-70 factor, ECF subfamily
MLIQETWERWLSEHGPRFLMFARQQTRSEADAQDVMQEAITEAWNRRRNDTPPPLGVTYAAIRHRAIDLARSDRRRVVREQSAAQAESPSWFDPAYDEREQRELIQRALTQLPEGQREVITLKLWGGLTFDEIGQALEIPPNTAASRYRYAIAELRKRTSEVLT